VQYFLRNEKALPNRIKSIRAINFIKNRGMMKQNRSILIGWQHVILALAVVLYGLFEPAYCRDTASQPFTEGHPGADGTVLLLQQSNLEAGIVTPEVGVHYFGLNTDITLTAIPKPGYYFLYWIGDVSDPTANRTIVYLDAPKIVLAVFERSEFAFSLEETMMLGGGGGGGRYPSAADYGRQGYSGGGGKRPPKFEWPQPPEWEQPAPPEVPDELPIPLPEPATVLLLGLGSLLLVRPRTKR
jgi:hypothetical protein